MAAWNEEENVAACMREALDFLREATSEYELILVDDGSGDDTASAARVVQAEDPDHIQVISYTPNRGIGGALQTGYAAASKDWVTWLPCDGQIPPEGLQNLFDVVEADPSIRVVTCTFPDRFEEADSLPRKVLSRGLRMLMWTATGVSRQMDGISLFPRDFLQAVPMRSETFFLNLELPIRAIRAGLKPGATTMHIRPRMAGESKVANLSRIRLVAKETLRLGKELRFG
jgi:glycosyltransferase involved in cell wall biosynthesis